MCDEVYHLDVAKDLKAKKYHPSASDSLKHSLMYSRRSTRTDIDTSHQRLRK